MKAKMSEWAWIIAGLATFAVMLPCAMWLERRYRIERMEDTEWIDRSEMGYGL